MAQSQIAKGFSWERMRVALLAVTFGGVLLALGKSLVAPESAKRDRTPFDFPAEVPLAGWQFANSNSLSLPQSQHPLFLAARSYQYQQAAERLEVDMYYITNSRMDVKSLMKDHASLPASLVAMHHQEGVGYYGMLVSDGQAYLHSCINPRGESTFTEGQFKRNRNLHDIRLDRLTFWLLGQQPLRDKRCLWTQLSIPVEGNDVAAAGDRLETIWAEWHTWWQGNFPKP